MRRLLALIRSQDLKYKPHIVVGARRSKSQVIGEMRGSVYTAAVAAGEARVPAVEIFHLALLHVAGEADVMMGALEETGAFPFQPFGTTATWRPPRGPPRSKPTASQRPR